MWDNTQLESELEKAFNSNTLASQQQFVLTYNQIKNFLINNVYSDITRFEPNLTDHGERHIQDVLRRSYELISYSFKDDNTDQYTALELYLLCTSILVHDIGNLFGRNGHENKIAKLFNDSYFSAIDHSEKRMIISIAQSHGGKGDPIKKLSSINSLHSESIRLSCLAAVLRFADELSEGPHRTSKIMLEKKLISKESQVFHDYSSVGDPPCIRQDTIILKYSICIENKEKSSIKELVTFIFKRVFKLNRERIYCSLYSAHIQKIKNVTVSIIFYKNNSSLDEIDMPKELTNFRLTNLNCNEFNEEKTNNVNEVLNCIYPPTSVFTGFQRIFKKWKI